MLEKSLRTLYYIDANTHEAAYRQRFDFPYTSHFDFHVKAESTGKQFPIFLSKLPAEYPHF